jgi:hypothetical protein
MSREPTAREPPLRPEGKVAAWPLLAGVVLGGLVAARLASEDDVLFTRDVQALLIVASGMGILAAMVLGLIGMGLRTLTRRVGRASGWPWFAPAWLAWWLSVTLFGASLVLIGWLLVTEGDGFA